MKIKRENPRVSTVGEVKSDKTTESELNVEEIVWYDNILDTMTSTQAAYNEKPARDILRHFAEAYADNLLGKNSEQPETEADGENSKELKPCPFCGEKHNLWDYINFAAARVECGNCGASIKDNCVRTAYYLYEELPKYAKELATKEKPAKDKDGNLIEMFWVRPTDAFFHEGITKRWNRRQNT